MNYHQYSDILDTDGKIIKDKLFRGADVYPPMKDFHFNDYIKYNSVGYYNYINEKFSKFSFPIEYSNLTFNQICKGDTYSLKEQQKFAARIFNTHTDNKGILIYHGLGSGKTQTSIIIGEAFKFRNIDGNQIPGRSDTYVLIVVPASLTDQYYNEIIGSLDSLTGRIKSAAGEVVIDGKRQYYIDPQTRKRIKAISEQIKTLEKELEESPDVNKKSLLNRLQTSISNEYLLEQGKVKRVYEIVSHETFINNLYSGKGYVKYLQVSNGCMIIDEAHKLVSAIGTNYRSLLYSLKFHSNKEFRVVLLTGTPIYDKPYEFGLLINLIRPRIPFPDGINNFDKYFIDQETYEYKMKNKDLFKQLISGYVSYFKGGNPVSYPYKKKIIVHHSMNDYQYDVYRNALIKEVADDMNSSIDNTEFIIKYSKKNTLSDDNEVVSVFNNSRMYSNIVFPKVPNELITKIKESGEDKSNVTYRGDLAKAGMKLFKQEIQKVPREKVLEAVSKYSSKFAKIVELVEMSDGPVFIYSNYNPWY